MVALGNRRGELMRDNIQIFRDWIAESDRIVFFGGAGVSTETVQKVRKNRGEILVDKTAIYCRAACGGNEESQHDTLDRQKNVLEAYAEANDINIVASYEDIGYSGCDLMRPGLVQLLEDYKAGKFDKVLVTGYDRLFRGCISEAPVWPFEILTPLRVAAYFRVGTKEQFDMDEQS